MKIDKVFICLILFVARLTTAHAQNGDQLLDGIGETGLMARYLFNGDVRDWSRNNLHAGLQGNDARFVNDRRFGKVLSLSGNPQSYLTLPGEVPKGLASFSITGWIYLRSLEPGQRFFDFGTDANHDFFVAPIGTNTRKACLALLTEGKGEPQGVISAAIDTGKWVYLAFVFDMASKSMITYVNSKPVGEVKDVANFFSNVLGQTTGEKTFYIGKSMHAGDPNLHALLHDFRVYRVPLSSSELAAIANHSSKKINLGLVNTSRKREDTLPHFSPDAPQLYNAYLVHISDIHVETRVGDLPRLPVYVKGTYRDNIKGPKVRVLWPSPVDNSTVSKPGKYTVVGRIPGTHFQPKAWVTVKESGRPHTPDQNLAVFHLDQVSLDKDAHGHKTKFIENRDKFIQTLAKTDPNSFLYMFRHAFGQQQPDGAKPLGVWDSQDTKLRGHATGHYLSAIAQAYAGTGYDKTLQANFAEKMAYMVNTLYDLAQLSGKAKEPGGTHVSDASAVPVGPGKTVYDSDLSDSGIRRDYWNWGTGFISAYPPDQFIMLEKGARYGGQKNQIWAPYYTLHKLLAGLLDVYEVSRNKKALAIATGMGNWVYTRLSQLPTETRISMWNTYIAGEYGGMNEVMARLYRMTGEKNYLKTAALFDNSKVFFGDTLHSGGLAKNVDLFRGLHANQHIPQIVGSIEMYRVSHNPEYYKVADNFWYKIVNNYMYSIGGVAGASNPNNAECFTSEPGTLYENGFSSGGQNETCATYNMLKLTGDLFLFNQQGALMDYYERALYNDILASVAENSPANTYHIPLRPGAEKEFSNPDMTGFTCCNGTALESNTKLQNSIYFKSRDDRSLYVNLYIPSTLHWTERQVTVVQTTGFPYEDQTRLTIRGSGKFDIHVRVPGWATGGFVVRINGVLQKLQGKPGTYLRISRTWKEGDRIDLKMPFRFHLDPVMDQQNIASLFYGPILLAAQEPEARKDWRTITLDAQDPGKTIQGDPKQLVFHIGDLVFKPFYESYGHYSVYLDVRLKQRL